ncbi:class I SAM-dependent methyltransferase [Lyngbya confervoides]|uniref:Class I SAM-dependent methyltransferase n=1 Tax=Lyngbya confervoides BDU141951 TaxID=1574623 RepID=A0ABD4T5W9_9CYAN|nr:class I SAM-dependent methyltransferase [Lyngbya confervoides]MCM1983945.1 class I SAM-dependent methyltransferase [Lyngbya confervoides BDU141951]
MPQLQKVAGLFDQWASSDRAAQMADGHGHLMQALLADLDSGLTALGTCLDLGCGPGRFLGLAADFGFQDLCGIDASEQMVATARQAVPLADIRVGPFEALPWPEQSFDLVASIEALYYCLQPDLALREVHRVLKPAGRFDLIIDYYAESSGTESWPEGLGFEITRWASSDWQAALEQVGFQVLRSQRIYHPQASEIGKRWTPSVWFPTAQSYARYLKDGALWITAKSG